MIVMRQTDGERNRGSERSGKEEGNVVKSRLLVTILVSLHLIESVSHEEDFFFFLIWKKGEKEKERKGESNISVILQI